VTLVEAGGELSMARQMAFSRYSLLLSLISLNGLLGDYLAFTGVQFTGGISRHYSSCHSTLVPFGW